MSQLQPLYTVQITREQADKVAAILENENKDLIEKTSPIEKEFKEAEAYFLECKSKYESAAQGIEDNKKLLENLSRLVNQMPKSKELRVMRTTSHTEAKNKRKASYPWVEWIGEYITRKRVFMTPEEIRTALLKIHNVSGVGCAHSDLFARINDNIKGTRRDISENRLPHTSKKYSFIDYEGKIGLREWVDVAQRPKAEFLKEYMYGQSKAL